MEKPTRKFIPIQPEVHQPLKELSVQEQLTFSEMVEKLMNFYKANTPL